MCVDVSIASVSVVDARLVDAEVRCVVDVCSSLIELLRSIGNELWSISVAGEEVEAGLATAGFLSPSGLLLPSAAAFHDL